MPRPPDRSVLLNAPQTEAEEQRAARSIRRGRPLGEPGWVERVVRRLGLERTVRRLGRPRKNAAAGPR